MAHRLTISDTQCNGKDGSVYFGGNGARSSAKYLEQTTFTLFLCNKWTGYSCQSRSSVPATGPKVTNEGHLFYVLGTVEPLDPAMPEGHLLVGSVRILITVCPVLPRLLWCEQRSCFPH